jgi:cell wall-associated NlpC family hydrolase
VRESGNLSDHEGVASRVSARTSDAVGAGRRTRSRLRPGRLARLAAVGATSLALAAAVFAGPATQVAQADPPLTVEEAKTQIEQLETEAAALDQDYVGVKEKLVAGRKKLKQKRADMAAQTARVKRLRLQVGQVALAQFQNRNLDTAAQLLFTRDTDRFLSQISTVEKISENQNSALQDYQAEQAELAELERSSETDVALLKQQEKELARLREASDDKIAESKALLARLTAEERARLAAEEKRAREAAQREAEKAAESETASADDTSGASSVDSSSSSAGSGKGATALAFAKAELGKPYRFAAAGPDAYDCSGLTSAAWKRAGVTLPRTSQAQYNAGRAVSKSELQPGDLVFFYGDLSHVGLYVGSDTIIHSPRPGKTVEYSKMSYMPYQGARRPG